MLRDVLFAVVGGGGRLEELAGNVVEDVWPELTSRTGLAILHSAWRLSLKSWVSSVVLVAFGAD